MVDTNIRSGDAVGRVGLGEARSHASGPAAAATGLLASSSPMRAARRLRYVVPSGSKICQ